MPTYLVMRPDNANTPLPVFTRVGRLTSNLVNATKLAHAHNGRLYTLTNDQNGMCQRLVADYFDPKPVQFKPATRSQRVAAALFGATLS